MAHNHAQSVAELRRESERTRAELSQTVETLREKVTDTAADIQHKMSPEHIKAEVSDYVAEKSRHWLDALKQQALENPMQALAAGTAVAVPAFKIARSMPLPLLMIGAGLALASPRVRSVVAGTVSDTLKTSDGGNVVDETAHMARDQWQSAKGRAEGAIDDARSTVTAAAEDVRETAAHVAGEVGKQAADLGTSARESLAAATDTVSAKVNAASEAARESFRATQARATETFDATRASAENLVRNNAALVGSLGLAIGALIAASLPSTKAEQVTLGGTSDALRNKAAGAASEKFDEVKTAAMSAAESAAEKVSDAAVGSRMSRATEQAAEKLKTVADDTITTAFEPSQSDHH
jgi:ElaB/YqjD/DUF883 family membrane-anchored ribosome-binding protein